MQEIYISVDIEADGPIPGVNSMISLGSAAFSEEGCLLDKFSANLTPLPDAERDPVTMKWWSEPQQQPRWTECQEDARPPKTVMQEYLSWLKDLPGKVIFVAYPAAYDFMFVQWYLVRFTGEQPFSHSGIDIKTVSMAMLGEPYSMSGKAHMPERWLRMTPKDGKLIEHRALDDAIQQGRWLMNMLTENRSRRLGKGRPMTDQDRELWLADYEATRQYFMDLSATRFKLLAFLPTITGTVVAVLFGTLQSPQMLAGVGAFGFMVTLGILFYDQRNTQIYDALVLRAQSIETKLGFAPLTGHIHQDMRTKRSCGGAFLDRPPRSLHLFPFTRSGRWGIFKMWHDRGLALIYSSVFAGWVFTCAAGVANALSEPISLRALAAPSWAAVGAFLFFMTIIHLFDWYRHENWELNNDVQGILGPKENEEENCIKRFFACLFRG